MKSPFVIQYTGSGSWLYLKGQESHLNRWKNKCPCCLLNLARSNPLFLTHYLEQNYDRGKLLAVTWTGSRKWKRLLYQMRYINTISRIECVASLFLAFLVSHNHRTHCATMTTCTVIVSQNEVILMTSVKNPDDCLKSLL